MSDTIKRSVLYYNFARAMWINLEKRFTVSNGSTKYRLNKELYDTKQNGTTINEYYTRLCSVWEELDSLSQYPTITNMTAEITAYMKVKEQEKEEQRLFLFLNGLDEDFSAERSRLLMHSPLPTLDEAFATLQQEEAQRDVLNLSKLNVEASAMNTSKGYPPKVETYASVTKKPAEEGCKVCGRKNHTVEKCWQVVGYPKGHPMAKNNAKGFKKKGSSYNNTQKSYKGKLENRRMAANAYSQGEKSGGTSTLTTQQVEQLLKLLPGSSGTSNYKAGSETDEEIEPSFAGLSFRDT